MGHSAYSDYCDAYGLSYNKREKFENNKKTLHGKNSACLEYCYCVIEV
jgi:hypothetical protein